MKRGPSASARAPSPTNTTYSGISNYRTDSYRPLSKNASNPAVPPLDPRTVARTHFDELNRYLATYLAKVNQLDHKEPANSRSSARQKLTRLTRQQFQELSTDVYDELMRRTNNSSENEVPFLPVRDDFHPKRNQARQKLATLPTSRFKDLSSDVYFELARRYPDFKEEGRGPSPESTYDDYPSPDFPNQPRQQTAPSPGGGSIRRPSQDTTSPIPRRRPSEDQYNDLSGSDPFPTSRRKPSQDTGSIFDRRSRPSQDTTVGRRSDDRVADREFLTRRPSESVSATSDSASSMQNATNTMIIPNKSTIAEEEIEVPYGRQVRDSGSTAMDESSRGHGDTTDGEREPLSPAMGLSGLSGLSARFNEDDGQKSGPVSGGEEYFDKMSYGRASVASDRSNGKAGGGDDDNLRREYEFKIATMQSKIAGLERDLGSADERGKRGADGEVRVRQLEDELVEFRRRADEHAHTTRALQKELEDLREDRARDRERENRRQQADEEELQILRERCERLEEEHNSGQSGADMQIVEQLRGDMEGLLLELGDLSRHNDELMIAKDADLAAIRDLDMQLKEYRRKYEQAKTELRSVKATSQLYLQAPKTDDQLPMSPDGGVLDVHVTAFVSAMDTLLTAGRTNSPTRVLNPMKAVVNAVSAIVEDLRLYERKPRSAEVDLDLLRSLRDRAEATLSNLVQATRTHATSSGMSPVSLLDAASSHLSSTVTEIGKLVFIRKATPAEQEQFTPVAYSTSSPANGYSPSLRSVDENKPQNARTTKRVDFKKPSISSRKGTFDNNRRTFSDPSSSDGSSPPPIFDRPPTTGVLSDDSAVGEAPDEAWNELKPYLDAQSDSIVVAIQSVLSGVRSPTPPVTLNENITQIITIVASIVAVCKDNLPPGSGTQGRELLRQLSEHANKLSEVQTLPEVTKESRQVMAKSSFAIANIMKSLGKMT